VLNPGVFDLVGVPIGQGGTVSVASIRDWSRRANHRGLRHVWWWSGGTSEDKPVLAPGDFDSLEALDSSGSLGRLVDLHRAQYDAISVGVDASWLGEYETGAQVALVQWLNALARRTDISEIRLFNLPSGQLPHYALGLSVHSAIRVVGRGDDWGEPTDILWRPNQPDHRTVVARDGQLGRRLVTTILDLIEYSNGRYHADDRTWALNRTRTRIHLSRVDMVTGISHDVVDHLAGEVPGLEPQRLRVTSLGVGHIAGNAGALSAPPDLHTYWPAAGEAPFLLVLGNDYMHKNRDFAIRVWQKVAQERRIDLVLAGLHVRRSSTRAFEQSLLHTPFVNGSHAVRLAHVSPAVKAWLLANAQVLLYPSSAEGFGFVPHEAASLGVPSLSTRFGPLKEFLPPDATADTWSIAEYAARVTALLDSSRLRQVQVASFRDMGRDNTWDDAAAQLADAFRHALRLPPRMPAADRTALGPDLVESWDSDHVAAVQAMTESLSWRVTKPLRGAAAQARRMKHRLR
jgi:glycosyltransferase involved in cell wall biosynthesis